MNKFFRLSFIILLFYSCGSIKNYNTAVTQLHDIENLRKDVDKAYLQLRRHHPRLYQYSSKEKLDFKFDSLKTAIKSPMTSQQFYQELAKVTKFVGQGHMSLAVPFKKRNRKERKAFNKTKFDINNIDFEYIDNKLIIRNARGKDSILKNTEVLKVNDENPLQLIKKYKETVATDGYNTTFHDRVVGYRFLGYYAYDNGRFDSIALTLRNTDSTFVKTYKRVQKKDLSKVKDTIAKDSVVRDSIAKPKKKLTRAEKKAKKLKSKKRFQDNQKYGYNYTTKTYNRNLSFMGKDSTIALLTIKSFTRGKKKAYQSFYKEVFTKIDSTKTENLIIDLRNNFGGRLNEIMEFYGYLTDKEYTLINQSEVNSRIPILKAGMSNSRPLVTKMIYGVLSPGIVIHNLLATKKKDGQLYYKFKASKPQEPKPNNYKGKIYVLINGNSFSASSILSTQLDGDNRATFVGEETGGAYNGTVAGLYKIYELPNSKVKMRIGMMHVDSKYKTAPDGYGIKPDIEILPKYQDRLKGIDTELQWILDDIEADK